ncbi:FtsH-binding integral membrane protein [Alkalibacillus flavidus]|uniref:FtsH-binding integral membrane protein n=1 Tax=Alkalibacillus flavidus TaxID=546021 RepID=A0ABV2KX11_9BACI
MLVRLNFMLSIGVFVLILLNYFTNVSTSPFFITALVAVVIALLGIENIRNGQRFNGGSFLFASVLLFIVVILGSTGVITL